MCAVRLVFVETGVVICEVMEGVNMVPNVFLGRSKFSYC